jgi:CRISPR-associated protein Cas8a1/Csx13
MAKMTKPSADDHLTMRLFAPGMSLLHRAGLGGLACTLTVMENLHRDGRLPKAKLPAPFDGGQPPWRIEPQSVTLLFGKPEKAGDYLKNLFAFAFQVQNGLIYLPGQYGDVSPSIIVLAAIQHGIQNTFLQHGPTCGSREGERTVTVEINDTSMSVTHDVFTSYKHQGWFWLDRDEKSKEKDPLTGKKIKTGRRVKNHQDFPAVGEDGTLSGSSHEIDNKVFPGGMVRHDRFDQSAARETDAGLICLHFALIGCVTLSINRVTAVLLVPEVQDLLDFSALRKFLTPQTAQDCRIAGAADAALQAQVRLRARRAAVHSESTSCYAMTCRPTQWNKKQKPRVATIHVPASNDGVLDKFSRALSLLPPRLVVPKPPEQKTRRVSKAKPKDPFWSDSVVRPLIAENLALARPWYSGFTRLMTGINPATDKPYRTQLSFERKGLHEMINDPKMWDADGEKLVVQAVHEAMRMRYGQIAAENKGNRVGMEKRMERFRERLRLSLAGAKLEADVRFALMDLFSRGGNNSVLRAGWTTVLPVVRSNWQLARDLGLLALASYAGKGETETPDQPNPTTDEGDR